MVGTAIIVSPYIDNVLLLVPLILFLYFNLSVPPRTNELIEVKEVPVIGKVHELGQIDSTSIGDAPCKTRRL